MTDEKNDKPDNAAPVPASAGPSNWDTKRTYPKDAQIDETKRFHHKDGVHDLIYNTGLRLDVNGKTVRPDGWTAGDTICVYVIIAAADKF